MTTAKKWSPSFVTVVAGASLALGACKANVEVQTHSENPPPPDMTAPPIATTVATTVDPPTNPPPPPAAHPAWDDVPSGHPENATNPPGPMLQLTTDGNCYKQWYPGMVAQPKGTKSMKLGGKSYSVRILTAPDNAMGNVTQIQCPEGAAAVLEENKANAVTPEKSAP